MYCKVSACVFRDSWSMAQAEIPLLDRVSVIFLRSLHLQLQQQ